MLPRFKKKNGRGRSKSGDAANEPDELLRLAVESVQLGVWAWHIKTGNFEITSTLRKHFGLPEKGDYNFEKLLGFLHPDDRQRKERTVQRALRNKEEFEIEYRVIWPDGSTHWIWSKGRPIFDGGQEVLRFIGVTRDITKQKEIDVALRESEEKLQSLMQNSPVLIFIKDREGRHLMLNPAFERITGITVDEAIGKTDAELHSPDIAARFRANDIRVMKSGEAINFDEEVQFHHGPRWFSSTKFPLRNGFGQIAGVCGISLDITDRKQVEQALHEREAALSESESKLRAILDNTDSVIYMKDLRGRYLLTNRSFEKYLNLSRTEIEGKTDAELFSARVAAAFIEEDRKTIDSNSEMEFEEVLEGFEPKRVFLTHKFPLHRADGSIYAVCGITTDITERKRNEEQIHYQLELFRSITDRAAECIFVTDENGLVTFANPEAENTFGFKQEELVGQLLHDKIHHHYPDGRPFPAKDCPILNVYTSGKTVRNHEDIFFRKDGSPIQVVCSNAPLEVNGRRIGAVLVVRDISERKRREDALQESERRLAEDLAGISLLLKISNRFVTGEDLHPLLDDIVDAAIALTHADKGDLQLYHPDKRSLEIVAYRGLSQSWLDFFHTVQEGPEACGLAMKKKERVIVEDVSTSPIFVGTPALNVQLSADIRAVQSTPLLSRSGELLGMLSTHFRVPHKPEARELHHLDLLARQAADFLERHWSQQVLKKTKEDLANANVGLEQLVEERTVKLRETISELESFAYTVSHDLRSPLRAMEAYSKILVEEAGPKLNEEEQDYLARIRKSALRMDALISDALVYSRVGRGEFRIEPVSLEVAIEEVLHSYPQFKSASAEIQVQKPLHSVMANHTSLIQCISNLLGNAFKFVHSGEKPVVRVWSEKLDGSVRLYVEDHGIGISESFQRKIFEPFQRAHQEYEGTGIGLAIVRKAVNRMGGSIGIKSEEGKGSTFWIELPAA